MSSKPRILFAHEISIPIQDGLWAALQLLDNEYSITRWHAQEPMPEDDFDLILGQGSFFSKVHKILKNLPGKKALLIAGTIPPEDDQVYDCIFYENEWYKTMLSHKNMYHAFGVNTDIFNPQPHIKDAAFVDYITVGAYSLWKRQHLIGEKTGYRMSVGEIQRNNMAESGPIIENLINKGVVISGPVDSKTLSKLYNLSHCVYIPAKIIGGGERAVLEARACGVKVEVEPDNPKLKEYCYSPIYDHHYYADQLKKGINSCL